MKGRILVVDDEEDTLNLTKIVLENEGYEVQTALNHTEAFEKIQTAMPDVILLDIKLPGMDGFEICRRLRSRAKTKAVPIIMFSASINEKTLKQTQEIGANGFLLKPFNIGKLISVVKKHLGSE